MHVVYSAGKWDGSRQVLLKATAGRGIAFYFDDDTRGCVHHPARQAEIRGKPVHGGPASDSLENPCQDNMFAYPLICGRMRKRGLFQDFTRRVFI
jgi:hypothetical protein